MAKMVYNSLFKRDADSVGALASSLCMVHCMATPFIFIAQSCSAAASSCASAPWWWTGVDFIFLAVSFFAVYQSASKSGHSWIKQGLYLSWVILGLLIINEYVQVVHLSHYWKYASAIALVGLHLYNRRCCA